MKLKTFEIIKACPECHGDGDEGSEGYPCGFCSGLGYLCKISLIDVLICLISGYKLNNLFVSR